MDRFFLLVCVGFLASLFAYSEIGQAPDFYWHLKTGLDFLESGLSPYVDHYSYSFPQAPLSFATPVFDVTLALFYKFGLGAFGVQTLLFVIFFSSLWIFSKTLSQLKVPLHLQLVGMVGLSMTFHVRNEPRPEMMSFLLIGILLSLYFLVDKIELGNLRSRIYLPFIVLLVVWTNLHTSSILGYAIGAALFLKIALRQFKEKASQTAWALWLSAGVASLAAGFLNRSLENILLHVFFPKEGTLDSEVLEFQPIDFASIGLPLQAVIAFSCVGIGLSIRRKKVADAFLVAVFLTYAFKMQRMLGLFPLVAMPFLIEHLAWLFGLAATHSKRKRAMVLYSLAPTLLALGIVPFLVQVFTGSSKPYTINISDADHPRDIVAYMAKSGLSGNIRNEYFSGGYLLRSLSNASKVFIDGRANVLYPPNFVREYLRGSYNSVALRKELERYPAEYVIASLAEPGGLLDTALESQEFEISFFGERHALLSRQKSGRFGLTSLAFSHPECLDKNSLSRLKSEYEFARSQFAPNSPVIEFLEIAIEYFENGRLKFFELNSQNGPLPSRTGSANVLRLIARLAEKSNKPAVAFQYISAIPSARRDDRLFMARIACQHNSCLGVEAMLDGFSIERAPVYDLAEAEALLIEAHRTVPAVLFPPDRMKLLDARLRKEGQEEGQGVVGGGKVQMRPNWCLERK